MKKLNLDKEELYRLYIIEDKSVVEISRLFGCCQGTVSNYLSKFDIESRPFSKKGLIPWNKNLFVCTNTGKTHFKKGQLPWDAGKKFSKEHVENLRKSHLGIPSSTKGKTFEEIYGIEKAKKLREMGREKCIKQLEKGMLKDDTKIEKIVENQLLFNNVLYVKQYRYDLGVADFWLPETNTIIECDGDYWHSLPGCKERDEKKTKWLEDNGYTVFRFSEKEIKNIDFKVKYI